MILLLAEFSNASSVKDTAQFSGGSFADSLNLVYVTDPWTLDLDYSYTNTQSPVPDELTAISTSVEYEFKNKFLLGGGLNYSNSKADLVTGIEPHITIGGTINLEEETNSDKFTPTLDLTLDLGSNHISQTPGLTTGPGPNPVVRIRQLDLTQKSAGLNIVANPWEWVSLRLSLIKYTYDKNVADFINSLQGARFFVSRSSSFANSISTLPAYLNEIALTFYFLEKFNFKADYSTAQEAANGDRDQDISGTLGYAIFESWTLALGFGQSMGATTTTNYGIAALTFRF